MPAGSRMGRAERGDALNAGGVSWQRGRRPLARTASRFGADRLTWRYSTISTVTDCGLPVALPVSASAALTVMVASPA